MSQEIIKIKIQSQDVRLFDRLVLEYGEGDPSKFLTYAIRKVNADQIRTKLQVLQEQARQDMGGRVFSSEETLKLIKKISKTT